ncbi:MAG: hypothetical protein QW367_02935 [Candidatus Aenigmatarchaeota archaeon]
MKIYINKAIEIVFKDKRYLLAFIFLSLFFSLFFVWVQITISFTTESLFSYFLALELSQKALLILISALISLNIVFSIFSLNQKSFSIKANSSSFISYFPAVLSGILSTSLCSSCIIFLVSLFGISFTTATLIYESRNLIILFSIALLSFSLYLQSKNIVECKNCRIKK